MQRVRRAHCLGCAVAGLILGTWCHPVLAQASLKERFLAVYLPGCSPLVKYYTQATVEATKVVQGPGQRDIDAEKYRYYSSNDLFRVDNIKVIDGKEDVYSVVADPHRSDYLVTRPAGAGQYMLNNIKRGSYDSTVRRVYSLAPLPSWAYCTTFGAELSTYLQLPTLNYLEFSYDPTHPEQDARLVFDYPNGKRRERGVFLFSPLNYWAVREASLGGTDDKSLNQWSIVYETAPGQVPRVKKMVNTYRDLDGKVTDITTVEVTSLIPGPVPEDQFALSAFGLTDTGLQQSVPPWYYIQIIVVVALVLMLIFRALKKSRTTPSSP